jgi:hypothetical protein
MTTIHEINESPQQVFEGYCRGGPINGVYLRHPVNFIGYRKNDGVFYGQYVYAMTCEWIWMQADYQKMSGGLLE